MRLLTFALLIQVVTAGCGDGSQGSGSSGLRVYPDRLDAFFDLAGEYHRDLYFRVATDAYRAGNHDIDFIDEHPGPYDDEEEGVLTEYSPDCTPCQWVVLSSSIHLWLSEIDDGDANTWRYAITAKRIVIATRPQSGPVDESAGEPFGGVIEGQGEAYFYVVPPEPFSPTHVDALVLPPGVASVLRAPPDELERVVIRASESSSVIEDELDGWDVYLELPRALISQKGSIALTAEDDDLGIDATYTANAAGWQRHFELSSGTLVVDTAAESFGDTLELRITDVDFADKGDEYLAPTDLHVTFDSIALSATLELDHE